MATVGIESCPGSAKKDVGNPIKLSFGDGTKHVITWGLVYGIGFTLLIIVGFILIKQ
jgi:hypothetical protein